MKRNELVDYMKGISILGIVLFHLISNYLNLNSLIKLASNFGGAGVHIFIICSGFGLYLSYLRKPVTFKQFIQHRFRKLYLPYVIIVLISFLFPFMYVGKDRILALLSHLLLFKMFIPSFESSFGVQMWFISTIFQFYFVFILLCKFKKTSGNFVFLLSSILISISWAVLVILIHRQDVRVWNSFFFQYLWEFSLGMFLGEQFFKNNITFLSKVKIHTIIPFLLLFFSIYLAMSFKGGILKSFNDPFSAASFGGVAIVFYKLKFFKKYILKLNSFSYELFLCHILIFSVLFEFANKNIPNLILGVVAFILSILSAIFFMKINKIIYRFLIIFEDVIF